LSADGRREIAMPASSRRDTPAFTDHDAIDRSGETNVAMEERVRDAGVDDHELRPSGVHQRLIGTVLSSLPFQHIGEFLLQCLETSFTH
jgi:hypothetical protein